MPRLNALIDLILGAWLMLLALLKTPLRWLAYHLLLLLGLIRERAYSYEASTTSGYLSAVSTSWNHCLAFRRADTGRLQFYW